MVRLGVGLIRSGRAQVFLSVKPWPGLPLPDARGGHEVSVEVVRKAVEFLRYTIVAAYQRVVAEHCGTRHGQAQRRHDQRLADQAGHLVGGCLAGCADGQQRGRCTRPAEQADEARSNRPRRGWPSRTYFRRAHYLQRGNILLPRMGTVKLADDFRPPFDARFIEHPLLYLIVPFAEQIERTSAVVFFCNRRGLVALYLRDDANRYLAPFGQSSE